jgi:hypothetical protein
MILGVVLVQDNCDFISCACSGAFAVNLCDVLFLGDNYKIAGSDSLPNCFVRIIAFQALICCDNVPRGIPKICSPITCCTILSVRYQALERMFVSSVNIHRVNR